MGGKMRAAWWWIDRWRRSSAYSSLTLAEQGAYRNLLDELWLRGGVLPKDERQLANVCGDARAWPRVRDRVLARFTDAGDGYRHETHDEVHAASVAQSERQAERGRRRAEHASRDGGRFQPQHQPNTSRSTSRPTSPQSPEQNYPPTPLARSGGAPPAAGPDGPPPSRPDATPANAARDRDHAANGARERQNALELAADIAAGKLKLTPARGNLLREHGVEIPKVNPEGREIA